MKNLLFLLTFIILSCSCMAQRIALSKSVSMSTQKKLSKPGKKELSSLISSRFAKTEFLSRSISGHPDDIYMVGDIVVLVKSEVIKKTPGILKKQALARDNAGEKLKDFSSKIENIGGRDVYIIDQVTEGLKIYRFTTVNRSEDIMVGGFVQYKPGDELIAKKVLEDIIKGLKFDGE